MSGPQYVGMVLEAFQTEPQSEYIPVYANASEYDVGTVYLYVDDPLYSTVTTGTDIALSGALGHVNGKCTRIDPEEKESSNYEGKNYCQFIYSFYDEYGEVEAQLSAEGPIQMSRFGVSLLPITGGTEFFRRSVGSVVLYPAMITEDDPPVVEWGTFFDVPSSFLMETYLWLDESLIPPGLL